MDKIPPNLFSIVKKKEVVNIGKLFDGQQQIKAKTTQTSPILQSIDTYNCLSLSMIVLQL
jgi:hypothetical protein